MLDIKGKRITLKHVDVKLYVLPVKKRFRVRISFTHCSHIYVQ